MAESRVKAGSPPLISAHSLLSVPHPSGHLLPIVGKGYNTMDTPFALVTDYVTKYLFYPPGKSN